MEATMPKKIRKVGSGRTRGSVSFCAVTVQSLERMVKRFPRNGVVVVSRKWVDQLKELGINTRSAKRITKN